MFSVLIKNYILLKVKMDLQPPKDDWAAKFLEKYDNMEEFTKISPDIEKFLGSGGGLKCKAGCSCKKCGLDKKTKMDLLQLAQKLNIQGRSKMSKGELVASLVKCPKKMLF